MAENPDPNANGKHTEPKAEPSRTWTEQFEVAGKDLVKFVENLVHEGNVRRVIVKQEDRVIIDLPLTVVAVASLVAALWAPFLAALGGVAGLALLASGKFTVLVERVEAGKGEESEPGAKTKVEVKGEDE